MKKFCSQSIRRAKTDKIDAVHIAQFGLTYWDELSPVKPPEDVYQELKLLARQYYQTVSMLVKAKVNAGIGTAGKHKPRLCLTVLAVKVLS